MFKVNKEKINMVCFKHSVHPSPFLQGAGGEGGGVEPPTKFSKRGGLDRTSTFRGGLLRKRGVTFSRGLQFSHKK